MSGPDATHPGSSAPGETLPEGEEAPPPGVRTMAVARWALVALMAVAAAGAWLYYADFGRRGGSAAAALYRCPMHPAVVQDRPGECPICGMDLVAAAGGAQSKEAARAPASTAAVGTAAPASAAAPAGTFWCPMHPEVSSDDPQATCPRCGGMKLVPRDPKAMARAAASSGAGAYWCPMHPEVTSDDPQATCPKCGGMRLMPRPGAPVKPGAPVPGLVPVEISAERTQLMGLRTARATRQRLAPQVRTVGFVSANERNVAVVTARASGFVDELRVAQVGQRVHKGEPLLTLYSGEVVAAQRAFQDATRWKKTLAARSPNEPLAPAAQAIDQDALRRLELYGVAREEIEVIQGRDTPMNTVPVRAPRAGYVARKTVLPGQYVAAGTELYQIADLSTVWVVAEIFEQDMERVAVGQRARLLLASAPGMSFAGRVDFIYPAVNPETRTLQARMEFRNPELRLRPGAFCDVIIEGAAKDAVAVPAEAVVDTGELQYVFVALPGGRFEPRAVRPGAAVEDRIEILAGVAEGESVVTAAAFLLDSESRLRATVEAHAAPAGEATR